MDFYLKFSQPLAIRGAWPVAIAALGLLSLSLAPAIAQDDAEIVPELSQVGALIDFARDVEPILAAKCLSCHGPEEAKNDFRVDEADTLLSYIEPGDLESSSLWGDYLVTDDPDMRMPPVSVAREEQLTGAELATIKLWIEEGGMWNAISPEPVAAVTAESLSMPARIWRFQGLFHPATTHFPIALLTISALFVLLSFMRPDTCEPVAFHCLWIGAAGAIVASMAGWSYAVHEGYPANASFNLQASAIDRHRWLGIAVAALALILIPVAVYVRRKEDTGMRVVWLLGSLLLLAAVGTVGFQGGELTYGEGHYEQEFVKLFPEAVPANDDIEIDVEIESDVERDTESSGEDVASDAANNDANSDMETDTDALEPPAITTSSDTNSSAADVEAVESDQPTVGAAAPSPASEASAESAIDAEEPVETPAEEVSETPDRDSDPS